VAKSAVMKRLQRNIDVIRAIPHLNKKQYKSLVINSDKDLIYCLSNVLDNVASGRVRVKPEVLRKLRKYRSYIDQIRDHKLAYKRRKNILVQRGSGIFSALIPFVVGTLSNLVGKIFRR